MTFKLKSVNLLSKTLQGINMKEKLLLISGSGMRLDSTCLLFRKHLLAQGFDVVEIGAETTDDYKDYRGFERLSQEKVLAVLEQRQDDKPINALINMHGNVEDGIYVLQRDMIVNEEEDTEEGITIQASDLIKDLLQLTNGVPLKILATSCYGAHLQDCLELLPDGSTIITLSDRDKETYSYDHALKGELATYFPQTLEELLVMSTLCQRATSNTPIVGVKEYGMCVFHSLSSLGMKHITDGNTIHSEFLKALLGCSDKLSSVVDETKAMVKRDHNVDPERFIPHNSFETYLQYCEGKISLDHVRGIILEANPLVDSSRVGVYTPFRKTYNKFKLFVESKMRDAGLEKFIDCDVDDFATEIHTLTASAPHYQLMTQYGVFVFDELQRKESALEGSLVGLMGLSASQWFYNLMIDNQSSDRLEMILSGAEGELGFQLEFFVNHTKIGSMSISNGHLEHTWHGKVISIDVGDESVSATYDGKVQSASLYGFNVSDETQIYESIPLPAHSALCVLGADYAYAINV